MFKKRLMTNTVLYYIQVTRFLAQRKFSQYKLCTILRLSIVKLKAYITK